jgi:1-acyl-sn-glycerol-3-phosphate acyltransferase
MKLRKVHLAEKDGYRARSLWAKAAAAAILRRIGSCLSSRLFQKLHLAERDGYFFTRPRRGMATHREPTKKHRIDADAPLPHPTRRNLVWFVIQQLLRLLFTVRLHYRARGTERIPAEGGGLVLVNHQSSLDPLLVGLPLSRPVSYVARDTLFNVPVVGWVLRRTYVMPIDRDAASSAVIRQSVARMHHGFLVGVFPEGTRTTDGSIGEFKPGFIALVRRGGVPVYPVGIAGAMHAMPRGVLFPRRARVAVVFGEPITPEQYEPYLQRGREQEMIDLARDRIARCQREAEAWIVGRGASGEERDENTAPTHGGTR